MATRDPQSDPPIETDTVFCTDRLLVRRWRGADEAKILALYSDERVTRWVDDGEALSAAEAARWMEVTAQNYRIRGYGMFAIDALDTSETLGFGGLVHPGGQVEAEVKYALKPAFWGRGYATEFVRGLLRYGKDAHELGHVIATVAAENLASQHVLIKSGFRHAAMRSAEDSSRVEVFDRRL